MTEAPTLFEMKRKVVRHVADMFLSVSNNQDEILRGISVLHNAGEPFELDPTYSKGEFYKNFQKPTLRFDLDPQSADVKQADCRDLPLASNSVKSVMFDPPFVMNGESEKSADEKTGLIGKRFTSFKNYEELKALYIPAINEFYRVLIPKGLFVIKCQDSVVSGKNYFTHVDVFRWAEDAGFQNKDLFILERQKVMLDSREQTQRHARKVHSYFIVFRKAAK